MRFGDGNAPGRGRGIFGLMWKLFLKINPFSAFVIPTEAEKSGAENAIPISAMAPEVLNKTPKQISAMNGELSRLAPIRKDGRSGRCNYFLFP